MYSIEILFTSSRVLEIDTVALIVKIFYFLLIFNIAFLFAALIIIIDVYLESVFTVMRNRPIYFFLLFIPYFFLGTSAKFLHHLIYRNKTRGWSLKLG